MPRIGARASTASSASSSAPMFVPYGRIYSLDAYRGAARHRRVHRRQALVARAARLEWDRLALRDAVRPDFHVLHRQRPRHRHGHVRLATTCSGCRPSRPTPSPRATGCGPTGDPAFYELNDAAPVPRRASPSAPPVPGLPPRRRHVPRAPRAGSSSDATPPGRAPPARRRPRRPRRHRRAPRDGWR